MTAKIGLIGGLGWPATVAYYEAICRAARQSGRAGTPQMTIESLDMSRTMAARGTAGNDESWQDFDQIFVNAFNRLAASGCNFGAIASVTPHNRLEAISNKISIPVISVVDAVSQRLDPINPSPVLVLGTSVTMQGTLFDKALLDGGFDLIKPQATEIAEFSNLLDRFFYAGRSLEGRKALIQYIKSLAAGIDDVLVILACTDLTPAFPQANGQVLFRADGVQFMDATASHVDAIMQAA